MEYRRRKRKRRAAGGTGGNSNGAARMVVALLVIAAIVYVISASTVGTWIAEKVIAPAFSAFDNLMQAGASVPTPSQAPDSVSLPQQGNSAQSVTGEVSISAMECFALQMGVYSDKSNAEREAEALQQRGAGGYVMEDNGKYRVLAAAYNVQESLKQVREQLTAEGMESASYVFHAQNSTLQVTAPQEQLNGITAGFDVLTTLLEDMAEETLAFDQQQKTASEGRKIASGLLSTLRAAKTAFDEAAVIEHPVLDAAKTCFAEYEDALDVLANYDTESFVDFSSKMKYTHICIVHAYVKLADKVSNL